MSFLSHACLCLPRLSQSHTGLNGIWDPTPSLARSLKSVLNLPGLPSFLFWGALAGPGRCPHPPAQQPSDQPQVEL